MRSLSRQLLYNLSSITKVLKMSAKKVLTLKVEPDELTSYTSLADSLNMNRSEMIRNAIADFAQKVKNPQTIQFTGFLINLSTLNNKLWTGSYLGIQPRYYRDSFTYDATKIDIQHNFFCATAFKAFYHTHTNKSTWAYSSISDIALE